MIRIGCSGWSYAHWRDDVYGGAPPARWLPLYAERFDTVEVNATFYRLASPRGVARWVEQTPEGFLFALKGSRFLTHMKRLVDIEQGLGRFYERLEALLGTPKLGPVLWQLPEDFPRDDARLAATLRALEGGPADRHAFEFRHPSWFDPAVYRLLERHDAALAIGDRPERPFQPHVLTAGWTYVRFHHGHRGRRGNYSEREIEAWAERIAAWDAEGIDVLAYYNNDWESFAVANAERLRALTGGVAAR